jgi:hypothetical protein
MALKTEHDYLPRFIDLYRNGMGICLETTKNELLLRELIGDRKQMHKMGSKIISLLLRALLTMDKADLIVGDIQPSSISIDKEVSKLMFNGIKTLAKEGKRQ